MPEKIPFEGMEEEEDFATTVLTCEGDITDPAFPIRLQCIVTKLQHLISDEKPIQVTKVEPWNSVRVTFNIPQEAAQRLRQLAERGDSVLRELGILSVQIEGDQVITLTLAGQFNEPQEIVLCKSSETQDGFSLPSTTEPVPGPSTDDAAHKSISQFLGHIVGGAAASASSVASAAILSDRPDTISKSSDNPIGFRSPNVIAPSNAEPLPFLSRSAIVTTAATNPLHAMPSTSTKSQPGFGPFPFASMTHAMTTKHGNLSPQYQPVVCTHSHLLLTTSSVHNSLANSTVMSLPGATRPQTVASTTLQKGTMFNNIISRVTPPNAVVPGNRANVALSSPLLVNLLQSETSNIQGHSKLMPPPNLVINQGPKRKRKSRKQKDRSEDVSDSVMTTTTTSMKFSTAPVMPSLAKTIDSSSSLTQAFSIPLSSISHTSAGSAFHHSKAKAAIHMQTASIHPQAQGQPPVSMHVQLQGQPPLSKRHLHSARGTIGAIRQPAAVPNIHPQAQGQPQVHTGNLPLHSHIPVGSPQVARPPCNSYSSATTSHTISTNISRLVIGNKDHNLSTQESNTVKSTNSKPGEKSADVTTPESNSYPSPPFSGDGKTKHLINPFTGQLEPMPSDEEEDEDESIGSLPPFPEFEIDTSENGQSERSLSDGGKENNHSSDTDSGISKSHTDISQSSTEGVDTASESTKHEHAMCKSEETSVTLSSVPVEKLKLRLKLDHKSLRESKDFKDRKECNPQPSQKIDVAMVSIPNMKKGSTPTEPRVPPLHISLRGPNAAVVVSPRKEDAKSRFGSSSSRDDHHNPEVLSKVSTSKNIRSPRSSKLPESLCPGVTNRIFDSTNKRVKCGNMKKSKDDYWSQNVKNMSGGGIVEMSEKIHSYESYLSDIALGAKKSAPGIQCKAEVITLTSCATGESVSIRAAGSTETALPFHVVVGAADSGGGGIVPVTSQQAALPMMQISHVDKVVKSKQLCGKNHLKEVPLSEKLSAEPRSKKDGTVSVPRRPSYPSMQKSSLPHMSGGKLDKMKSAAQLESTNQSSNQIQRTSAICVPTVPPTPLVEMAEKTATTSVAASPLSGEVTTSSSTGVNKLPSDHVTSVLQTNSVERLHRSQCNISPANSAPEVSTTATSSLDLTKIQNKSAFSNSVDSVCKISVKELITATNEVQIDNAVNTDQTANHYGTNSSNVNSVSRVNSADGCKNTVFSTFIERCRSPLANYVSTKKREMIQEVVTTPDKKLCIIEVKSQPPPIAQIITLDGLPVQSRVMEVPSLSASLETNRADLTNIEMSSIPSLIPSDGGDSSSFRRTSGSGRSRAESSTNTSKDGGSSFGNIGNGMLESLKSMEDDGAERSLSAAGSEESSMDSIDEERKRCLSEVKTSTPGPPSEGKSSKSSCSELSSNSNSEDTGNISLEGSQELTKVESASEDAALQLLDASVDIKDSVLLPESNQTALKPTSESVSHKDSKSNENESVRSDSAINTTPEKPPSSNASVNVYPSKSASSDVHHSVVTSQPSDSLIQRNRTISTSAKVTSTNTLTEASLLSSTEPQSKSMTGKSSTSSSSSSSVTTTAATTSSIATTDSVPVVCTSSNLATASYLPQGREVNTSNRVRLIFKGGTQHSMLSGCNSPTGFVLPLNSTKTVPIKLVTLPAGASVRSTSNPNVVEIIGTNANPSHSSSSSGSIHRSSPVRLVVSKVSPGSVNPNSVATTRSRMVVKSVVVSGASSPLKLSAAKGDLCTALPISTTSSVIAAATLAGKCTSNAQEPASSALKQVELKTGSPIKLPVTEEKVKTKSKPETESKLNVISSTAVTTGGSSMAHLAEAQKPATTLPNVVEDKSKAQETKKEDRSNDGGDSESVSVKSESATVADGKVVVKSEPSAPDLDAAPVAVEESISPNPMNDLSPMVISGDQFMQIQPYLVAKEVTVESDDTPIEEQNCSEDGTKICNTTDCFDDMVIDQTFLFEEEVGSSPKSVVADEDDDSEEKKGIRPKLDGEDEGAFVERNQLAISLVYTKPVKRKCSENAAELIKACMGVDDSPKRSLLLVPEVEINEKVICPEKIGAEETIRTSLRLKKDAAVRKLRDCSSDEELALSELVNKTRTRERPSRSRLIANRESPTETLNSRPLRRRSGSTESRKSDDLKLRNKDLKRDAKKLPERTKRGVNKGQTVQRNTDSDVKSTALNTREETKRKTRSTGNTETGEVDGRTKRRRYSKDGHR